MNKSPLIFSLLVCFCMSFSANVQANVYDVQKIMDPQMHNICALTFDDGPHPRTIEILDVLQEEGIKATFFVLGSQVSYYPKIVQRTYADGHEVASHAYTHMSLAKLSTERVRKEILDTNAVLEKNGIPKPRFLRPPLGEFDGRTVRILKELDMDVILWSTDSYDWMRKVDYANMPNMMGEKMTQKTQRGVFLFHDTKLRTAREVGRIIHTLRSIGCERFVTISEYADAQRSPELLAQLRENMSAEKTLELVAREEIDALKKLEAEAAKEKAHKEENASKAENSPAPVLSNSALPNTIQPNTVQPNTVHSGTPLSENAAPSSVATKKAPLESED